jgi:hypothetical protein
MKKLFGIIGGVIVGLAVLTLAGFSPSFTTTTHAVTSTASLMGTEVPSNGAVVHPGDEPGTFSLVFFYSVTTGFLYEMQTSTDLSNYTAIAVFDFSRIPPLPPQFKLQLTHTVSDTGKGPWPRLMQR